MEQLVRELKTDVDRINDWLTKQIDHATQKLSTAMISLENKTQQDIVDVNSRIESVKTNVGSQRQSNGYYNQTSQT
jgi:methyl-accepting chemotaxis protein